MNGRGAAALEDAAQDQSSAATSNVSILIVDDRPENILALEAILKPMNVDVVSATSGEGALKQLLKGDFAVILLDVHLPGMNGFETATRIKQRERTRDVPIIFLTAVSREPHHAMRGYSAGAVDYISKPYDPWLLRAKIALFIDLHEKNSVLKRQRELLAQRLSQLEGEVAERKLIEAALRRKSSIVQLVAAVATASNEAGTIEEAIQVTLDRICAYNGWPVGHAYLVVEGRSDVLKSPGIWHIKDADRFSTFVKASESLLLSNDTGPAGRALSSGRPVWTRDVMTDQTFKRADVAQASGLRACFAFPILAGAESVGVLEFFANHAAGPDESLLEVATPVANQLGRVVERNRVEDQLRRLDAAKTEFIAYASHELRTPLQVIAGVPDVLLAHYGEMSEERVKSCLHALKRQTERMNTLANSLLDISGTEFSLQDVGLEPVDLALAVDSAVRACSRPAECALEMRVPSGLMVLADSTRLEQVLTNLLMNAIKYGGPEIWVEAQPAEANVVMSVCDNGGGVAADLVDRVFDPFTRGDHTDATVGSGLGLAICRRLVESFGGWIWYEPDEGVTRFKVRLTRAEASVLPDEEVAGREQSPS